MPTTFQLVETTFPNGEGKDTQEQINGVYDYLFVLLEQLRYTLFNLDGSNINQNALSEFIKNISEPIYAKIEDTDKNVNELSITAQGLAGRIGDAEGNITQLQATATGLQASVSSLDGSVTNLTADVNGIRATVSGKIDGSTAQTLINQSLNSITLAATSGESGTVFKLNYNGAQLASTGSVDLCVNAVNIYGKLTASQIQTGSIYVGDLKDGSDYATKTYVENNAGLSASEVDDAIATYIDDTSITAEKLRGRTVELLASNDRSVGSIELAYTTTGDGIVITTEQGGVSIESGGNVYIASAYSTRIQLDDEAAKIGPNVWATNGTVIYDSDRNIKNSIEYDLSKYRQFLLDLKPCRFKYNDGQSGRYHLGVIAQDVEQSLADNGIAPEEFSGWCKSPIKNKKREITGYTYGIRYDSLIPLNTMMIQELVQRVEALEKRQAAI